MSSPRLDGSPKMASSSETVLYADDWGTVSYRESSSVLEEPLSWLVITTRVIESVNERSPGTTGVEASVESHIALDGPSASSLDFTYRVHSYVEI